MNERKKERKKEREIYGKKENNEMIMRERMKQTKKGRKEIK
jgi:hypothetical protein